LPLELDGNFDYIVYTSKVMISMLSDILDQLPLFQGFSPEQFQLIRPLFVACDCYTDTQLFEQGTPAEFLFLVVGGEVAIRYKPDDGPALTVARVRPGGVVGWSAALGSRLYTSGAVCTAYTQMLRVRGSDLRTLCEEHPDTGILILERLATVIAERLRNTHEQVMLLLKQGLRASVHNV
jgi:CRP/FNR family cyclic AMP-dependent transcriptional regulator